MKKIIIAISAVILAASCAKFDEMSKNPYTLYDAPAEEYVHPIMFKTQYNLINVFRTNTILLMQYAVSTNAENSSRVIDNYNIPEALTDDVWLALYLQLGNAAAMYDKAVKDQDGPMQAVALILQSFLITQITDTYGDVPFSEACVLAVSEPNGNYTMKYDTQKDIYRSVILKLEKANELLGALEAANNSGSSIRLNFSPACDKTFGGNFDKWRRFGNSLYARVLLRIAMKVIEEDGGVFDLNDDESINVKSKLSELYANFRAGGGDYPQMRSIDDRPLIPFSDQNEIEHTPFYTTTSGSWNTIAVSDVLYRKMLDTVEKGQDEQGIIYYEWKSSETAGGHIEDPRYDCWWRKPNGMPVQLEASKRAKFLDSDAHKSTEGNSKIGRMVRGKNAEGKPEPSRITGKIYDLQNASYYPLMQYSELLFLYAEAGARGWINTLVGFAAYQDLFKKGSTASILEWNPYVTADSQEVVDYVSYCTTVEKYSEQTFNSDNALEAILTQKWLSNFFISIESWCDYRRTGYPILITNGEAARNDHILPTRMRYPADEAYRNPVTYPEALERLGGTNNIKTDVWWADTEESKEIRLKGRTD